ncbi:MAG TPA: HoxN/HupN/NixA family nickel/cobalt transporter, partial [Spirochaetia bacterium]|nr:HoxN/HupN/NixA family nickel/cobalt transporter [Spirochaetia bacterium]
MQFPTELADKKPRIIFLFGFLLLFNLAVWITLILLSSHYRAFLPLGMLAYVFGLRHAADADHIAAIDNTTRKLINDGQRPVGVGFFFSAGHSTVVVLMTLVLAAAGRLLQAGGFRMTGLDTFSTAVSAAFLFLIAFLNLIILRDVYQIFQRMGDFKENGELEKLLLNRGLMNRIFGRLFQVIKHSWQMYPVGLLFGLGFDTVSEVAVLAMAGGLASKGVGILYVLLLPLLFSAGVTLVDSADGVLMLCAYNWAFMKPV